MCGRFGFFELRCFLDRLRQLELPFEKDEHYHFMPGYNIAPESTITALLGDKGVNILANAHWGLVPHWAETMPKVRPINARAESLGVKPYFRHMLNRRHCLIPASGFYEWSEQGNTHSTHPKQPWYIHRADGQPMAFAGLWDIWQPQDPEHAAMTSCTIITTHANRDIVSIHKRMPVIVEPENWKMWLEPGSSTAIDLLRPAAEGVLEFYAVSTRVNNPQYIRKECIEPLKKEIEEDRP